MPFPFVELPRLQVRPALVVSAKPLGTTPPLAWSLMITSAANKGWPGDISLEDRFRECGLPSPSVIRTAKIGTVEIMEARAVGRLPDDIMEDVIARLRANFGMA